jgi:ketosteroid isomerase-like protein
MNPHAEQTERTQRTVNNHLQSFSRGDLDALMADYAETAIFCTPEGILRGKAEIRAFFEQLLVSFPPGSTFEIAKQIVDSNLAYLVWAGESQKLHIPLATDTILLHNGRIAQQTFAAQIQQKLS